jgi:hypothetical protein
MIHFRIQYNTLVFTGSALGKRSSHPGARINGPPPSVAASIRFRRGEEPVLSLDRIGLVVWNHV